MNMTTRVLLSACLSCSTVGAFAAGTSKPAADQTMNKDWTIEECRAFMANRPSGASRDDRSVINESRCSEMMKNEHGMSNDHSTMLKNSAGDPKVMKKDWTIQECRDRMTRPNRENVKQDQDSIAADRHCADLMKQDGTAKTGNSSTGSTKQ